MSSIYDTYETVIGLEVHMQLDTKSKAYCSDENEYGALPNSLVSPISLGHPGTLPKANKTVVEYGIRLGLAIHSDIANWMHYARKNYFYADLPKGYQITQDTTPICSGGYIDVKLKSGDVKRVGITRAHMEEDSGKSIHDQDPYDTLVDLNRAGVPLLELVSEPDMRSSDEAYAYLAEVRKLVRYLEICDGNMEEGSLRCDANISVRKKGTTEFGTRCEVKNMNSFRNVQRAIDFEAKRQIDIIEAGGTIHQETRGFDAVNGTTHSLRSKEQAHDYRYFPEPDLQPLMVTEEEISRVKSELPPLPNFLFDKYTKELKLSEYDASILTEEKGIALYYEQLIAHTKNYKAAANWLMGDIKSYLNENALRIDQFPVSAKRITQIIALLEAGKISSTTASSKLFPAIVESDKDAETLAKELNIILDTSDDEIVDIARGVLAQFPDKVEAYKAGNKNLLGMFMGQFMKQAKGKADPKKANQIIAKLLAE